MVVVKSRSRCFFVCLLALIAASACASPAEMQNMVVTRQAVVSTAPQSPFKNALAIARVDGGEETNPLWTSQVDNPAFRGALAASLEQNGLLPTSPSGSRFELAAVLASINQPLIGLDMTVGSNVRYRVVERKTKMVWFDDSIYASYTATFSDSPLGVQRLRLANEGSIRENIKAFISRLNNVQPPTSARPGATTLEERLRALKKLLDDGLISREDYDRKRSQILKDI